MKLRHCYIVGRFHNAKTGQTVNIHKGQRVGRGDDHYFYLLRGKRVFISCAEKSEDWQKVRPESEIKALNEIPAHFAL